MKQAGTEKENKTKPKIKGTFNDMNSELDLHRLKNIVFGSAFSQEN